MKRIIIASAIALTSLSGCTRVEPNSVGVLQENYGKNGKSDFTITQGSVNTMMPGVELYQVPLFEQRGEVSSVLNLKITSAGVGILAMPFHSVFARGLAVCCEKQKMPVSKRMDVNVFFIVFITLIF